MSAESYLILWASQTGNAEWIAKNIHSEAKKRGYKGDCVLMNDYEKSTIDTVGVLIFVSSNTGDGDPPDNALKFWRFLRRQKEKDYFKNRQITCLGLGDTNYSNFNNTIKRIEKKCKELGASVFYEKGMADDAEGLENVVDPWIEHLWDALPKVLESQGAVEEDTSVDKVADLLDKTSIAAHQAHDQPYSFEGRKNDIPAPVDKYLNLTDSLVKQPAPPAQPEPYSFKGRTTSIPDPVQKYLALDNSLVKQPARVDPAQGTPVTLDYSGLTPGIKLTAIPKAAAANVQWTSLATLADHPTPAAQVPDWVVTPSPISYAPVTLARCLTTDDAVKRSLLVELAVENELTFEPGDAFGIVAPNDEQLVHALVLRLAPDELDGYNMLHQVKGDNLPSHLEKAQSLTLVDVLRYGVDLTSAPRKALLRMLADHTSDLEEKTRLMYLCSKQGLAQFNALRAQSPTLLDLLTTFPSCQPPTCRLLDLLPAHQPRYYSIANSPISHNGRIRFVFNVVEYTTPEGVSRRGVATPWLDSLTGQVPFKNSQQTQPSLSNIHVPIFVRPNNPFALPVDTKRPLLLIGPGTGVAPLLGFAQHRQAQRLLRQSMGGVGLHPNLDILQDFGPIHLYDGCRDRSKDYLFPDEFQTLVNDRTITKLNLAISREDPANKTYVQDLLRQHAADLYDFIVNQDAAIYICGDAKGMAKGVNDAFVDILVKHEQLDVVQANQRLVEWMSNGKYLRDLWA
ncbi:riboflavin synthase domain-like protein [Hesseltinella vesiculosa]|uniref:Methionine synthase reductase n=1 Tax=Hesseltinella vesiculosa TaxID=101127 RepID=A0A1X2GVX7_9FUNG|nr:riboflavin synthase domain-like protein [Hesseltinella vesiculosa]